MSDTKLDLAQSTDFDWLSNNNNIKVQRFKKIKKGSREVPSISYLTVTFDQLDAIELADSKPRASKNLAAHILKDDELGSSLVAPLSMKILFAQKLRDPRNGRQNLVTINKIMLKARSVFIHLSAAEETDSGYTSKFIKEFPFNVHIPQILSFTTLDSPSVSFVC